MIAVDGRRSAASGMTCDEMRDLALDLGCWDASMQDGGGSTNLVVEGDVKNVPSDGSPRHNANHIGVILADSVDPQCQLSVGNGARETPLTLVVVVALWVQGIVLIFGATCEEGWATMLTVLDYQCPNGEGNGMGCLGATEMAYCNDGWYFGGDCAALGLSVAPIL